MNENPIAIEMARMNMSKVVFPIRKTNASAIPMNIMNIAHQCNFRLVNPTLKNNPNQFKAKNPSPSAIS